MIRSLRREVNFPIKIDGDLVTTYRADHVYEECTVHTDVHWFHVVEDVKSRATAKDKVYVLKKALMRAVLGITIREV